MLDKGIAAHTIFLIGVITITVFFIIATFMGWIDWTKISASRFACSAKLYDYCRDWGKNDFTKVPWDWNKKGPQGCGEEPINIFQPTSKQDCEKVIPI